MAFNVLFVTVAAVSGVKRFCHLSAHMRHAHTKKSGLILLQGDHIAEMYIVIATLLLPLLVIWMNIILLVGKTAEIELLWNGLC